MQPSVIFLVFEADVKAPKCFGLPQGSLPHRLRAEPLAEGAKRKTYPGEICER